MPASATLEHYMRGNVVVAHVHGELDLTSRDMLLASLDQMGATGKDVVINLADLAFMDIGTATVLQRVAQQLAQRGQSLTIVDPIPIVRRLLILLGMDALLDGARRIPEQRTEAG